MLDLMAQSYANACKALDIAERQLAAARGTHRTWKQSAEHAAAVGAIGQIKNKAARDLLEYIEANA